MADKKFPIGVYNKDGALLQVNSDDELLKAKAKGYNPKYVHTHFPKFVYNKDTGESRLVNNEGELQALGSDYVEEFVAPPAPVKAAPAPESKPSENDTATVRALLGEIHDLKNQFAVLDDRMTGLEEDLATLAASASAANAGKANKSKKTSDQE